MLFDHFGEKDSSGVYLMMGQPAKKVLREAGLPREIEVISAGCLPDEDVEAAAQPSTTFRRLQETEFDRLYRHGWEVADCNLSARRPDLFSEVTGMISP